MTNELLADLRDRLGFEVEVLRIIADQTDVVDGTVDPTLIELTSRRKGARIGAKVSITVSDTIGSGAAKRVLDAVSALTLLSCFKALDVMVEWVLGLNEVPGRGAGNRYTFEQKVRQTEEGNLTLPVTLEESSWLWDVALALYAGLVPFRHEVVHRHSYSVVDGVLRIEDSESEGSVLELDELELGSLARFIVGTGAILTEDSQLDLHARTLMMFYADQVQKVHGREPFGQKEPLRITVKLIVPEEDGAFVADLSHVRSELVRIHSGRDTLFDLDLAAVRNDETVWEWRIPYDAIPEEDELMLTDSTLLKFRKGESL